MPSPERSGAAGGPAMTWVNHASFVLELDDVRLVTDPWLSGRVFDDGWELMMPSIHTPADMAVTHVWISHEHPDHFHPATLRALLEAATEPPTLLFRPTLDGRVRAWADSAGFTTLEPAPAAWVDLGGSVSISVNPFSTLDSWAAVRAGGLSIVNLNDCPIADVADLDRVREVAGDVDVLISQFGPASWLGNPEDEEGRRRRSRMQLDRLRRQIDHLEPTWVVPAASFIRFCHEENCYLNDNRVGEEEAVDTIRAAGSSPVVLRPGEVWNVGSPHAPEPATAWYGELMRTEDGDLATSASVPLSELVELGAERARHNREDNNRALARLLEVARSSRLRPAAIQLWDLDTTVEFVPTQGVRVPGPVLADGAMHSSSLANVLRHGWGFDTLRVNGRFRTTTGDVSALASAFWLGPWNSSGHRLDLAMVRHLFTRRLKALLPRRAAR